jgi:hypothetical protein
VSNSESRDAGRFDWLDDKPFAFEDDPCELDDALLASTTEACGFAGNGCTGVLCACLDSFEVEACESFSKVLAFALVTNVDGPFSRAVNFEDAPRDSAATAADLDSVAAIDVALASGGGCRLAGGIVAAGACDWGAWHTSAFLDAVRILTESSIVQTQL